MSSFEALYGQSCNTPISWSDLVNRVLIGREMLAYTGYKENLKATQDRNKIYAYQNKLLKEL